jgi:heme oxygenase
MTPDPAWAAEEARLWNAMQRHYEVDSTRRNARRIKKIREAHRDLKREEIVRRLGLLSNGQVLSKTWQSYERWQDH